MKRKVLNIVFASLITILTLVSCGSNQVTDTGGSANQAEDSGAEEADVTEGIDNTSDVVTMPLAETKNFSMLCNINGDTPMEEVDAFKYLNEQSNITFNVNSIPWEDAPEKEGLILSSGDYPDVFIFSSLSKDDVNKYGAEGIFVPLEEHIKKNAPNLTKYLDENDLWPYVTAPDGHVYVMPGINTGAELSAGFHVWLNYKWLDNLGLEEPKSVDELYTVLKAFKEEDANGNGDISDEIAISVPDGINYLKQYLPYFGLCLDNSTWLAEQDGELIYIPTDDRYKEFLRFFTNLYNEGILDPASFTQNYDQIAAVGGSNEVLGCFSALASFQFAGREQDEDYQALTPFEGQDYPKSTGISYSSMMVTDACEDPATLVAWADQLYTQEGGILYWLGVEGNSYTLNDDGSWAWNLDGTIGEDIATVREKGTLKYQTAFPGIQPDFWATGITDPDESYLITQRAKMVGYGKLTLPAMTYSVEETETLASLKADLDAYINQYGAQVITGALDLDSSWEEYVGTMNAMGASEIYEIYKGAFDKAEK